MDHQIVQQMYYWIGFCETDRMTENRLRNLPVLEPDNRETFIFAILVWQPPVPLPGPANTTARVRIVRAAQPQRSFIFQLHSFLKGIQSWFSFSLSSLVPHQRACGYATVAKIERSVTVRKGWRASTKLC